MTRSKPPILLTIAGSDPSGGAGLQGDLKTFSAHRCYGMAVVTAITVQNTYGVLDYAPIEENLVAAQISALLKDAGRITHQFGLRRKNEQYPNAWLNPDWYHGPKIVINDAGQETILGELDPYRALV